MGRRLGGTYQGNAPRWIRHAHRRLARQHQRCKPPQAQLLDGRGVQPLHHRNSQSYEKGKRSTKDPTSPAGKERDVLLGKQSPAALCGMLELKRWQERYQEDLMIGEDMFQKELYAQAMMRPVASLWKVFEMKDTSGL